METVAAGPADLAQLLIAQRAVESEWGAKPSGSRWSKRWFALAAYQASHDLNALIAAVAGTYATDPNYGTLAATIAGQTNVSQAIAAARQ